MDKIKILNIYIDNISKTELLHKLNHGVLVTPNIDDIMKCQQDVEFYNMFSSAEYKICDSRLLHIISKLLRTPIKEAIPGSSFFTSYYTFHAKDENIKIFLLGAKEGIADIAKDKINKKVGRKIIVGTYSPPFGFEQNNEECQKIVNIINDSTANVLVVGLGNPKQTKWIYNNKNRINNIDLYMGLGATIDFEAGYIKRAPTIIQKLVLEWFYRMCKDPKRLIRRYLIDDLPFFYLLLKQIIGRYKDPFKNKNNNY